MDRKAKLQKLQSKRQKCIVYTRVMGYHRPVESFNIGKKAEHKERKFFKGKGFKDSYSRMSWDKPAPTITTKFFSISNGRFAHPEENRAISLREGATLQTFPKDYVFYAKSMQANARMIGNAVPPEFARRIGEAILKGLKSGN